MKNETCSPMLTEIKVVHTFIFALCICCYSKYELNSAKRDLLINDF